MMIRFQRIGRTNDPAFRIVLIEKGRAAKAGKIIEQLGTYNPKSKALNLDGERIKYWISMGAQPTDSIHNLLIRNGTIEGKKINALPKKTPQKNEAAIAAEAAAIEAAKVAAAATVAAEAAAKVAAAAIEVAPAEVEVVAEVSPVVEAEPVVETVPEEVIVEAPAETPVA